MEWEPTTRAVNLVWCSVILTIKNLNFLESHTLYCLFLDLLYKISFPMREVYSLWSEAPYPLYMIVKHRLYEELDFSSYSSFFWAQKWTGLPQQNLLSSSVICQQQNHTMLLNSFPMLWKTIVPSALYFITYSNKTPQIAFNCSFPLFWPSSKSTGLEHKRKQRSNLVRIMRDFGKEHYNS